jgi:hypothetical protein
MGKRVALLVLAVLVALATLACEKEVVIDLGDDAALKMLTKEDINKLFRDYGDYIKSPAEIGLDPLQFRDTVFPVLNGAKYGVKVHDVSLKVMIREEDNPEEFRVLSVEGYGTDRAQVVRPKLEGRIFSFAAAGRYPRVILIDKKK